MNDDTNENNDGNETLIFNISVERIENLIIISDKRSFNLLIFVLIVLLGVFFSLMIDKYSLNFLNPFLFILLDKSTDNSFLILFKILNSYFIFF